METNKQFIEEIRNAVEDGKLEITQWEEEFLESVEERLDVTNRISKRQRETLDRIHEKIRPW
jgi:hypothetical protein